MAAKRKRTAHADVAAAGLFFGLLLGAIMKTAIDLSASYTESSKHPGAIDVEIRVIPKDQRALPAPKRD